MGHRKNGLKAFGLSFLAVLGLMAFVAAGAQANWEVEGKELTTNETVKVEQVSVAKLVVSAKNIEFQCAKVAQETGLKLVAKSGTAEGKVKFSSCKAFSPPGSGTESKNCNPKEPIVAGGKALLKLHNGQSYVLFEPPTEGGKFTTVEVGELCALTETSDVTGETVFECGELNSGLWLHEDCATSKISHDVRPASASLFPTEKLSFGKSEATLAGDALVELNGTNIGKSWAGGHV